MGLETTDLTPRIGTLVESDLATLLSGARAGELRELAEARGVLVIRGAEMDDAQQLAFTRTLGPVFDAGGGEVYKVTFDKRESPDLWEYNYGNFSWHIDRTDTDLPPFASILNAKRLAPEGGETEFANTYAAYDDLAEADKRLIEGLRVVHKVEASYREAVPNPTEAQRAKWRAHAAKVHPLVWHHRSGRKSLVTSTSGTHVIGMDEAEGAALLARLMAWATQSEYVYVHEWQLGDVVMWDNTGTMHRVRPYDLTAGRLLHRTTVLGDEPFDPDA
ncbi:MAG: TauD/TfdA family dioxygenase [Sphingomonadales bacterium]|nr:TauD/TfdA family dioxygenase [Sphingomonadales bacterium]